MYTLNPKPAGNYLDGKTNLHNFVSLRCFKLYSVYRYTLNPQPATLNPQPAGDDLDGLIVLSIFARSATPWSERPSLCVV